MNRRNFIRNLTIVSLTTAIGTMGIATIKSENTNDIPSHINCEDFVISESVIDKPITIHCKSATVISNMFRNSGLIIRNEKVKKK